MFPEIIQQLIEKYQLNWWWRVCKLSAPGGDSDDYYSNIAAVDKLNKSQSRLTGLNLW